MKDILVGRSIEVERIDAVNGNKISIVDIDPLLLTHQGKLDAIDGTKHYPAMTRGGVGCALSHWKIYKKMIDDQIDTALILEDDININVNDRGDFMRRLEHIVSTAPDGFDAIYVGYSGKMNYYGERDGIFRKANRVYGTFGYVITKACAIKMLNMFPVSEQIDTVLSNYFDKPSNSNPDDRIVAYIVDSSERLVFSDPSSANSQYGTDIQITSSYRYANYGYGFVVLVCVVMSLLYLRRRKYQTT
jgi:GR25 family glycosyltransferase involved in LPS biosynthesis